jgi:hypothetical protein
LAPTKNIQDFLLKKSQLGNPRIYDEFVFRKTLEPLLCARIQGTMEHSMVTPVSFEYLKPFMRSMRKISIRSTFRSDDFNWVTRQITQKQRAEELSYVSPLAASVAYWASTSEECPEEFLREVEERTKYNPYVFNGFYSDVPRRLGEAEKDAFYDSMILTKKFPLKDSIDESMMLPGDSLAYPTLAGLLNRDGSSFYSQPELDNTTAKILYSKAVFLYKNYKVSLNGQLIGSAICQGLIEGEK